MDVRRRGQAAFGITAAAALYGVALLAWVIAVPSIDGQTLLQHGGTGSLVITAQPLVVSLLVGWALRLRCSTGSRPAAVLAWVIVGLYLPWSLLGALSFAAGSFPAALLLVSAAGTTPAGSAP